MNDKEIMFFFSSLVVFFQIVFGSGTYIVLYMREKKISKNATAFIRGTVVSYSRYRSSNPPVVEYIVDGITYKQVLRYRSVMTFSAPWYSIQTYTRDDLLAPSIRIYRNSLISVTGLSSVLRIQFPIGSKLTVWYDPANPISSCVERYCGLDRRYKMMAILFTLLFIAEYVVIYLIYLYT